jgi:hypothetical protein
MTQAAFDRGDWEAVIQAHALESPDPEAWLRYAVARLHTLNPGPHLGRQQQQVALAFLEARHRGASPWQIEEAQRQAVLLQAHELLTLADLQRELQPVYPGSLSYCIWQSPTPYTDLLRLGQWALQQSPTCTTATQDLAEAAWRSRDPLLLAKASQRLVSNPLDPPWTAYYRFLFLTAAQPWSAAALVPAALTLQREAWEHSTPIDEPVMRWMAAVLSESGEEAHAASLQAITAALGNTETILHSGPSQQELAALFVADLATSVVDAQAAARLYTLAGPSLRKPWFPWHDPAAAEGEPLDRLRAQLLQVRQQGVGFSVVRLGDGEGLFLAGRRPDLGGALRNGDQPDEGIRLRDYQLSEEQFRSLRQELLDAIRGADLIGIPDVQQCLSGPPDYLSVAASLATLLPAGEAEGIAKRLIPGGCHLHNYLLHCGAFAREPFRDVQAVIAPSLPQGLCTRPGVKWAAIPGELQQRGDGLPGPAHFPAVYEQTIAWIRTSIGKGDLVLIAAGILGKVYCQAVKEQGGIAVDIGSVVDLCSGHGGTRGEYRLHPYLVGAAAAAFGLGT